jgi:hypothetical protein
MAKGVRQLFYYRSSKKAVREISRKLASAGDIISPETLLDHKGHDIGVRVVGRFNPELPPENLKCFGQMDRTSNDQWTIVNTCSTTPETGLQLKSGA